MIPWCGLIFEKVFTLFTEENKQNNLQYSSCTNNRFCSLKVNLQKSDHTFLLGKTNHIFSLTSSVYIIRNRYMFYRKKNNIKLTKNIIFFYYLKVFLGRFMKFKKKNNRHKTVHLLISFKKT